MTVEELGLERALGALEARWGPVEPSPMKQPVFVLSAGWRSGSTLLQRIVASTGEVFMWGEPYDMSGLIQRLAESLLPFDHNWPAEWFIRDGSPPSADEWIANAYPHPRHLIDAHRALLLRLFSQPAEEAGFERWGLKEVRLTGEHAFYLRRLFPNAVFLIIHRDPYDAYASYRSCIVDSSGRRAHWWWDWPNKQLDSPRRFGQAWRTLAESLTTWAPRLGALVIPYEELGRGQGLDAIETAIGATIDRSVLDHWIADRDRANLGEPAWGRAELSAKEISALRSKVDPLATTLGYPGPATPPLPPPSPARRLRRRARRALRSVRRRMASVASKESKPEQGIAHKARVARLEKKLRLAQRKLRMDPPSRWDEIRTTSLKSDGASTGVTFAYHPRGVASPYPALMYAHFHEHGLEPTPLRDLGELDDLDQVAALNLHWIRTAPDNTTDPAIAVEGARAIIDPIERLVDRGGRLVWSVHEPVPHDADFPEIEIDLRAQLSRLATRIHLLHSSMLDSASSLYPIDEQKVFVVEHPLYTGYYPDYVSRESARRSLGIPDDAVVLLAFGAVRRYKGTDRLIRALPEIRRGTGRDVRVVVAGWTPRSPYLREVRRLVESTEGAVMARRGPPDQFVHVPFRAADIAVQPYWAFHNSGVSFLSLTFDCPIVAPRAPVSEDLQMSGMVRLFDPDSDEDLAHVVIGAITDGFGGPRRPAPEFLHRHDPGRLSGELAVQARSMLDQSR